MRANLSTSKFLRGPSRPTACRCRAERRQGQEGWRHAGRFLPPPSPPPAPGNSPTSVFASGGRQTKFRVPSSQALGVIVEAARKGRVSANETPRLLRGTHCPWEAGHGGRALGGSEDGSGGLSTGAGADPTPCRKAGHGRDGRRARTTARISSPTPKAALKLKSGFFLLFFLVGLLFFFWKLDPRRNQQHAICCCQGEEAPRSAAANTSCAGRARASRSHLLVAPARSAVY